MAALENYVKFLRGTPTAFANLQEKDKDTLYFIAEKDSAYGSLYLGTTLLAGGAGEPETITLDSLKDVMISNGVATDHLLVFDASTKNWVNKSIDDLIPVMEGTDGILDGVAGLVPAARPEEAGFFLRADGTWAKVATESQVFHAEPQEGEDHIAAITRVVDGAELLTGNIAIVKEPIVGGKYQHTAYVYDSKLSAWKAMDGNYNAENVYFDEDLLTTSEIGVITLENGQATIPTAGKNLKEVFNTILVKEENPVTVDPSVTVTLTNAGSYEVGSKVKTGYSVSFDDGSYSFGPEPTGAVATAYSVSNGFVTQATATGSFDEITVTDSTDYKLTATVTHTAGNIPVTNTGNEYEAGQITEGSKTGTSSAIKGYRPFFYGMSKVAKEDIVYNSDLIRSLINGGNYNTQKTIKFTAADMDGVQRFIIAIPASSTRDGIESATITSSMNVSVIDFYVKMDTTIPVAGKDGYATTAAYDIWVYEPTSIATEEIHSVVLG